MKDATGELSMTAIAVVAIAAVAGIFTVYIYPRIRASLIGSTQCQSAICNCQDNASECDCSYYKDDGTLQNGLKCPNPNKQNGNDKITTK